MSLFIKLIAPIIAAPWFTRIITAYMNCPLSWIKNFNIRLYIKRFDIDLSEAVIHDWRQYTSFNHFFTRALKAEARPIDLTPNAIISPVDGVISEIGRITEHKILQAKNHYYQLSELVVDPVLNHLFGNGQFATLYLSPRDYHRIHMPCDGTLKKMIHVPGKLFSVNPKFVDVIPNLFARNERVICHFDSDKGPFVVIFVGATLVASIETRWAGLITPHPRTMMHYWDYENGPSFKKGEEIGRFQLGSTIILLFPSQNSHWKSERVATTAIKMGQCLGEWVTGRQ